MSKSEFEGFKSFTIPKERKKPQRKFGHVYFLLYRSIPVYIGQTVDIKNRLLAHSKDKTFDDVVIKKYDIADLRKAEKEFICQHKPIYNFEACCKNAHQFHIIDNLMFCRMNRYVYEVKDGKLFIGDKLYGYFNGNKIAFYDSYRYHYYDFSTNLFEEFSIRGNFEGSRFWELYGFDEEKFEFFDKPDTLPNDYVFPFGKYKGHKIRHIKNLNPQYITWFEENIPSDQW